MGLVYGVDFGTSNSAIMVGRPGGGVLRVRNPVQSLYEIPSAVCLRADGTMAVGSIATRMKLQRPAYYLDEFKRNIGDPVPHTFPRENPSAPPDGRAYPTYELVAEVLRVLKKQAEDQVPGEPELVVLTVPASWQESNRDYMRQAAEAAGFPLDSVRLVTEPEAGVAYALHEQLGLEERTLLVYDLGGGTFDCAVVRGRGHLDYTVLGEAGGLEYVGGTAFDREIMNLIAELFPEQTERVLDRAARDAPTLADRLKLVESCESIKRTLSVEERFTGVLTELGMDAMFELTQAELAELLAPLLGETLQECERVLGAVGLDWPDLDGVVPVGGSIRLPLVGETIARHTGAARVPVRRVDDPELAVAHGAVLHAFRLQSPPQRPAPTPPRPADPPSPPDQPSDATVQEENPPTQEAAPAEDLTAVSPRIPSLDDAPAEDGMGTDGSEADSADPYDFPPASESGSGPGQNTFHAWNAPMVARARKWETAVWWVSALAVIAAIIDFGDWFTSNNPGSLITQDRLTIVVSALAALSGVVMAFAAWMFDRALLSWGSMATAAGATFGIAAIYHFLDAWLTKAGLVTLIIVAVVATLITLADLPPESTFITDLMVDSLGLTFTTADRGNRSLPWAEIRSLNVDSLGRLVATPVSTPTTSQYAPLSYDEHTGHLMLFHRHHFGRPQKVAEALSLHGGEKVGNLWT